MRFFTDGWTVDDVLYEWSLTPQSIRLDTLRLPDFDAVSYMISGFNRTYVAGEDLFGITIAFSISVNP